MMAEIQLPVPCSGDHWCNSTKPQCLLGIDWIRIEWLVRHKVRLVVKESIKKVPSAIFVFLVHHVPLAQVCQ